MCVFLPSMCVFLLSDSTRNGGKIKCCLILCSQCNHFFLFSVVKITTVFFSFQTKQNNTKNPTRKKKKECSVSSLLRLPLPPHQQLVLLPFLSNASSPLPPPLLLVATPPLPVVSSAPPAPASSSPNTTGPATTPSRPQLVSLVSLSNLYGSLSLSLLLPSLKPSC